MKGISSYPSVCWIHIHQTSCSTYFTRWGDAGSGIMCSLMMHLHKRTIYILTLPISMVVFFVWLLYLIWNQELYFFSYINLFFKKFLAVLQICISVLTSIHRIALLTDIMVTIKLNYKMVIFVIYPVDALFPLKLMTITLTSYGLADLLLLFFTEATKLENYLWLIHWTNYYISSWSPNMISLVAK